MFEDLVSVYRNFLGQRSGSVSPLMVCAFVLLLRLRALVILKKNFHPIRRVVCHSFFLSFFSFFFFSFGFGMIIRARVYSDGKYEVFVSLLYGYCGNDRLFFSGLSTRRLNGLVLCGRPCHVSAPFGLS